MTCNRISAGDALQAQGQFVSAREASSVIDAIFERGRRLHDGSAAEPLAGSPPTDEAKAIAERILSVPPPYGITGGTSSHSLESQAASAATSPALAGSPAPQGGTPPSLPGGIDWLGISIEGSWDDRAWERNFQDFRDAAELARLNEADCWLVDVAGQRWRVQPRGRRHQNGYAEIVAESEGIEYHFSQHKMRVGQPLVWITASSMILMKAGAKRIRSMLKETIHSLGISVSRAYPSRVDVCIDLAGVAPKAFAQHVEEECYITRAQDSQVFRSHRRVTGMQIGRGIVCRIYDKLLETADQPEKRALMIEKRWGGRLPEAATRVEFQLRREELRERFSIDTLDDLWDKLASLVHQLTHKWLRLTEEHVDRINKHQGRCTVATLWQQVQTVFAEVFGKIMRHVEAARKLRPETKRLLQQSLGCLLSSLAIDGRIPDNDLELFQLLSQKLAKHLPSNWSKILRERIEEFQQRQPAEYALQLEGVPF